MGLLPLQSCCRHAAGSVGNFMTNLPPTPPPSTASRLTETGRHDGTSEGSGPIPFDWAGLVPHLVHPVKLVIIEAMRWTGQPLSASDLSRIFKRQGHSVGVFSYHLNGLVKVRVIVKVRQRVARGAVEKFYFLR